MRLDEIDVSVLRLQPDDVIVLRVVEPIDDGVIEQMGRWAHKHLAGHRVLLIPRSFELEALPPWQVEHLGKRG